MPATLRPADSPVTNINGFLAFAAILPCLMPVTKKKQNLQAKSKAPSTHISYLTSLQLFLTYIIGGSATRKYITEWDTLITNEDIRDLRTSKPCGGCHNHPRGRDGCSTQHHAVHPCQRLLVVQLDIGHSHKTQRPQQRPDLRLWPVLRRVV